MTLTGQTRYEFPMIINLRNIEIRKMKYFLYTLIIVCLHSFNVVSQPVLENEFLKVWVNEKGAIQFSDKENNVTWGNDLPGWVEFFVRGKKSRIPLENAELSIEKSSNTISVSFLYEQEPEFEMAVKLSLKEKYFDVELEKLTTTQPINSIEYPAHILNVNSGIEGGYIVAPNLQGIMIPSRYDAGFMRFGQNIWEMITNQEKWWTLESGSLNMPWFGAHKENSSTMVYVKTSSDCMLHLIGNKLVGEDGYATSNRDGHKKGTRISSLTPIWLASKEEFAYSRKMRIELVENGYVGMAKRYKKYAKETGRFVTMKEKIRRNPQYEKIIGAPDIKVYCYTNRLNDPRLRAWSEPVLNGYEKVNTTFEQVAEMSDELKALGVEKCMFLLGGWNRMGYDREHVDMWPPAEKAGGIEGLKNAAETVTGNGYLFALHDNYDDFYPDAPTFDEKYILRDRDGSLHQGGIWDGGISYITCPAQRMELLNRNMKLVQEHIPLNAYYFDVITNTSHYECYDERHPINRKEDLQYRLELLKNITDRGLVIGGERGTDWAMPVVAFCEGLSGGGTGYHRGVAYRTGITIPLFYMVYHECVVGYWQHGTPYGREDHANHVLHDLLCAQPSSWSIEYNQWEDLKPLIKETYDLLSPLHQNTAHSAMINHKVLSNDFMVQHSEFDNGTKVWVNYGITTFRNSGLEIPPKGFRIEMEDKPLIEGRLTRNIEIY